MMVSIETRHRHGLINTGNQFLEDRLGLIQVVYLAAGDGAHHHQLVTQPV